MTVGMYRAWTDRIIYFSLLPTGVLNNQSAAVYILLGEVPIYLFFSIYTALVSFWYVQPLCWSGKLFCLHGNGNSTLPRIRVELVHFRLGLKRSQAKIAKRIKFASLGVNVFMYSLLVTLLIFFSVLEYYAPSSMVLIHSSIKLDELKC